MTGKQRAFVEVYLTTWNATRAAGGAGYQGNAATLAATGSRLLRSDKVKAAISERLQETAIGTDEALSRLWELATTDPGDLAEVLGETAPGAAMATARRLGLSRQIKKIQPAAHGVSVEWHDPLRALELIMRHVTPSRHEIGLTNIDVTKLTDAELESLIENGPLPRHRRP